MYSPQKFPDGLQKSKEKISHANCFNVCRHRCVNTDKYPNDKTIYPQRFIRVAWKATCFGCVIPPSSVIIFQEREGKKS